MRALILAQIPDPDIPSPIAGYQLALIGMDNHIVHRASVWVVPLYTPRPRIPDLDRPVFRARHHPFPLAVERHAGDVAGVSVECEYWVWVRGADVVELDVVVAGCGEVALVGGDAEAIDLRVGVLDCARADAGERFPEPNRVVVTSCGICQS